MWCTLSMVDGEVHPAVRLIVSEETGVVESGSGFEVGEFLGCPWADALAVPGCCAAVLSSPETVNKHLVS